MVTCPLCSDRIDENEAKVTLPDKYRYCKNCELIFALKNYWPELDAEKRRYLKHKNSINDIGYVNHLGQAISPVIKLINQHSDCLDFGCGPYPTLSLLIKQQGFGCDIYDPLFFPELPDKKYDFIFATECFEHFFNPASELKIIKSHLKENGYLIIMTELWDSVPDLETWWYIRDFTHVVFYHSNTIRFIANNYNFRLDNIIDNKIIVLQNVS